MAATAAAAPIKKHSTRATARTHRRPATTVEPQPRPPLQAAARHAKKSAEAGQGPSGERKPSRGRRARRHRAADDAAATEERKVFVFPEAPPRPLRPRTVAKLAYFATTATIGWVYATLLEAPRQMYTQAAPQQRNLGKAGFHAPRAGKRYV